MKSRYDRNPGKDAAIANVRQRRMAEMHSSANQFVKAEQAKLDKRDGKAPKLEERYSHFDAEMMNNGRHAQELAVRLTAGLDKEAYPVRPVSTNQK